MNAAERAVAVRRGAGLFRDLPRGVIGIDGSDRTRWLNGMISGYVAKLASGPSKSGCYAVLLTPQGRIVADLQVLDRSDAFWLDVARPAVAGVIERLSKYVIADDVELCDRTPEFTRLGLEGPAVGEIFGRVAGAAPHPSPDACVEVEVAGVPIVAAAFGWSGEAALQFYSPPASAATVASALLEAGAGLGLVEADSATLEILRIEAGVPWLGADLDETVLPAEAGLDRAVASDKGCYTGQEVVERLRSRGQVSHRLVGLTIDGAEPFAVGVDVDHEDKRVGEVTSSCRSDTAVAIALAFVRRAWSEVGTELRVGGRSARVAELPFVARSRPRRAT